MTGEPLTLDKLRAMMALMPKPETFLSSAMIPPDKAIRAEGKRENFLAAHPMFWARAKYEIDVHAPTLSPANLLGIPRPLFGIDIVEVDPHPDDSEETAEWRHSLRVRFAEALCEAAGIDHDPYGFKAQGKFGMGPMAKEERG